MSALHLEFLKTKCTYHEHVRDGNGVILNPISEMRGGVDGLLAEAAEVTTSFLRTEEGISN